MTFARPSSACGLGAARGGSSSILRFASPLSAEILTNDLHVIPLEHVLVCKPEKMEPLNLRSTVTSSSHHSSPQEQAPSTTPLSLNASFNVPNNTGTVSSQLISAPQQNLAQQMKNAGIAVPQSLVTVVTSQQSSVSTPQPTVPVKVNFKVRVTNPMKKKEYATYVLRDISKDIVSNPMDLRRELYRQFGSELVSSDLKFAIGYVKGSSYVYIRSVADMDDVWKMATTVRSDTIL